MILVLITSNIRKNSLKILIKNIKFNNLYLEVFSNVIFSRVCKVKKKKGHFVPTCLKEVCCIISNKTESIYKPKQELENASTESTNYTYNVSAS